MARKVFADSVVPLPDQMGLTDNGLMVSASQPEHQDDEMTVLFSLGMAAAAQQKLEERIAAGEIASPEELAAAAPQQGDVNALTAWLTSQGYQIVNVTADGVYARAKVSEIEKSLAVDMVRVTRDGLTYSAAKNAPSLPEEVSAAVHAIVGLQPYRQAHKHNRRRLPSDGNRASAPSGVEAVAAGGLAVHVQPQAAVQPTPNIANRPPYLVSEILKAYNADKLPVTGKGQTIAILIDTFPTDSDMAAFWAKNGLPSNAAALTRIEKINVKGGTLPAPEGEETLDASWTSGIAPDAKIRIYATGTLRFVDLDMALDRIISDLPNQPGMRQVSISLGLGERFMPQGEINAQHTRFVKLAAAGVNVFVSSGDAGSNPDETGHSSTGPTQAEYESSDAVVVGVGGTSLRLQQATGAVSNEVAWPSSGGGRSVFFTRPSWQKGKGVPTGKDRLVPDVSASADPNEGAFLVVNGQVTQIGGTSWSAPIWAGFCALINEARTRAGKPPLSFLNPLIYPLMSTSAFRDIKSGSNGAFSSGPGYDMVTGIGVPNVRELIAALS